MIRADFQSLVTRARKTLRLRDMKSLTESEQKRMVAEIFEAVAAEIQRAYDEQKHGTFNWRLSLDDVARVNRVAAWLRHNADTWDWQQDPLVAQRMRAGLPVDGVDGLPPRPAQPKCERATQHDLPVGFPRFRFSWSEIVEEFLQTRRGAPSTADVDRGPA